MITVIPAQFEHIAPVAIHMRQADRDEVSAASGKSPFEALEFSLAKSSLAHTVLVDGEPAAMFGVGDINILAGVGAPWLLGTNAVERDYVGFLRRSVWWRSQLLARYSVLRNVVDVRNRASVRWLSWLGFTLHEPFVWRGHQFRMFELRSDDVRSDGRADAGVDADRSGGAGPAGAGGEPGGALQCAGAGDERHAGGSACA